jgi:hypothetical protein
MSTPGSIVLPFNRKAVEPGGWVEKETPAPRKTRAGEAEEGFRRVWKPLCHRRQIAFSITQLFSGGIYSQLQVSRRMSEPTTGRTLYRKAKKA